MPIAANPTRRDFFVYVLCANGQPFYVGIGRDQRAADRIRWVKSQLARESKGLKGKWVRHTRVIAQCLRNGIEVRTRVVKRGVKRAEALEYERDAIGRYLRRGCLLANHHYNKEFRGSADEIVANIKAKAKSARRYHVPAA
jgi:hypothetical protein